MNESAGGAPASVELVDGPRAGHDIMLERPPLIANLIAADLSASGAAR
ncbi:hypothetical protein ACSS7Z_07545 [Microbacterium sp. A82]